MFSDVMAFLVGLQGLIREEVAADLRAFSETHDWASLLVIFPFGIAFGAIHALTPGHSKTLLASYVAGSDTKVAKGVGVASLLSFTHILMSVLIALLALPLVERTLVGAGRAPVLEDISRGLIAAIGGWMIYRGFSRAPHAHPNGFLFGITAGLIPCPLTLFTMTLAIARGVPEAGLAFAVAMLIGVALTLSGFAVLAAISRDWVVSILSHHGAKLDRMGRMLEAAAGAVLLAFGLAEMFR